MNIFNKFDFNLFKLIINFIIIYHFSIFNLIFVIVEENSITGEMVNYILLTKSNL